MGLLDSLLGTAVADFSIAFRAGAPGGAFFGLESSVNADRRSATPGWLQGPNWMAALALHYTAYALYTLGGNPQAHNIRESLHQSSKSLQKNGFDANDPGFLAHTEGTCQGQLLLGHGERLWARATFRVPGRDLNDFIEDSVLVLFSHVLKTFNSDARQRITAAFLVMEEFWKASVDGPQSLRGMKEGPDAALHRFLAARP